MIAALDDEGKPFIADSDTIGCMTQPLDFVCSGTASDNLLGVCETLWEKDMVCKTPLSNHQLSTF